VDHKPQASSAVLRGDFMRENKNLPARRMPDTAAGALGAGRHVSRWADDRRLRERTPGERKLPPWSLVRTDLGSPWFTSYLSFPQGTLVL